LRANHLGQVKNRLRESLNKTPEKMMLMRLLLLWTVTICAALAPFAKFGVCLQTDGWYPIEVVAESYGTNPTQVRATCTRTKTASTIMLSALTLS
jgi:hypothetical protein